MKSRFIDSYKKVEFRKIEKVDRKKFDFFEDFGKLHFQEQNSSSKVVRSKKIEFSCSLNSKILNSEFQKSICPNSNENLGFFEDESNISFVMYVCICLRKYLSLCQYIKEVIISLFQRGPMGRKSFILWRRSRFIFRCETSWLYYLPHFTILATVNRDPNDYLLRK